MGVKVAVAPPTPPTRSRGLDMGEPGVSLAISARTHNIHRLLEFSRSPSPAASSLGAAFCPRPSRKRRGRENSRDLYLGSDARHIDSGAAIYRISSRAGVRADAGGNLSRRSADLLDARSRRGLRSFAGVAWGGDGTTTG